MRAGIVVAWLLAATASAAGCSTTVDGAAVCPGCGNGTEPEFPNARPTDNPTMPTSVPLPGDGALTPNSAGYVYIETTSGKTRCQISADPVGCESEFTDSPIVDGEQWEEKRRAASTAEYDRSDFD